MVMIVYSAMLRA